MSTESTKSLRALVETIRSEQLNLRHEIWELKKELLGPTKEEANGAALEHIEEVVFDDSLSDEEKVDKIAWVYGGNARSL